VGRKLEGYKVRKKELPRRETNTTIEGRRADPRHIRISDARVM
jgi:hypothetical protein